MASNQIEKRPFAKVYRSIWDDPDFLALPAGPQLLFLKLLSQRNTDLAGLTALSVTRWSRLTDGSTPDAVREDLALLQERGFVVVDYDYEELLIRTMMRNDTLWNTSYKTQLGVLRRCLKATSPIIRQVLAEEIHRCLHMFTIDETKGIDIKAEAIEIMAELGTDTCIEACIEATAYPKPQTADRRPQTADDRPQTAFGTNLALGGGLQGGGVQNAEPADEQEPDACLNPGCSSPPGLNTGGLCSRHFATKGAWRRVG